MPVGVKGVSLRGGLGTAATAGETIGPAAPAPNENAPSIDAPNRNAGGAASITLRDARAWGLASEVIVTSTTRDVWSSTLSHAAESRSLEARVFGTRRWCRVPTGGRRVLANTRGATNCPYEIPPFADTASGEEDMPSRMLSVLQKVSTAVSAVLDARGNESG